jgi:hypothetical protein
MGRNSGALPVSSLEPAYALRPITLRRVLGPPSKKERLLRRFEREILRPWLKGERYDRRERRKTPRARLRPVTAPILRQPLGRSVAIYAHYNPAERLSPVVAKQVETYASLGFDVIFVSMSPLSNEKDIAILARSCCKIYERQSFGRDFGAWKDVWDVNLEDFANIGEVLLVNDSNIGPIHSLDAIFNSFRTHEGCIGLVDSPDRLPHLQSFFILFRGTAAIETLGEFFSQLILSFDKKRMIVQGELALATFMKARGVPLLTIARYDEMVRLAVDVPKYRDPILGCFYDLLSHPFQNLHLNGISDIQKNNMIFNVWRAGINPTHFFWRILIEQYGYPFIKTELLIHNPVRMPDTDLWCHHLAATSPVSVQEIEAHLQMYAA